MFWMMAVIIARAFEVDWSGRCWGVVDVRHWIPVRLWIGGVQAHLGFVVPYNSESRKVVSSLIVFLNDPSVSQNILDTLNVLEVVQPIK